MNELNRVTVEKFRQLEKMPVVLVLDNIRSQHNTGSVFRTADAFRIEKIILCGITATPPNREIQKTALGATESVEWSYFESTREALRKLKENGYRIAALEQVEGSTYLSDYKPLKGERTAFVFGNEVHGVNESVLELVDECIEIPQFGTKHSFNVSVSSGILLWHYYLTVEK